MSIRALNRVWENSKAELPEFVVLLALADYADEYGKAWPSALTLAKKARVSERTVQRAITKLHEELKELDLKMRSGPSNVNEYWILCYDDPPVQLSPPSTGHLPSTGHPVQQSTAQFKGEFAKESPPGPANEAPPVHGTGCPADVQQSPNPSGTVEPPKGGVTGEIPDEPEVLAEAKSYPGNLAIGAPAGIPELWAVKWYSGKLQYQRCNWDQWRRFMRLDFEVAFRLRDGLATGEKKPGVPAGNGEGHSLLFEQLRQARDFGDAAEVARLEKMVRALQ